MIILTAFAIGAAYALYKLRGAPVARIQPRRVTVWPTHGEYIL